MNLNLRSVYPFGVIAMRVHEIMHHVLSVSGDLSVAGAAQRMDADGTDSVLVHHSGITGICTEHDILRKIVASGRNPSQVSVADVMSYPLHTISWDDSVEDASERMNDLHVRRLVVIHDANIIGVISAACIARNVMYIIARRLTSPALSEGLYERNLMLG